MNAITGYDAKFEMWLILKNRRGGSQDNIGEQDVFRVQPYRTVHRSDQRSFDVEDVHEDLLALPVDLVVALRAKEVEALRTDGVHKCSATTGQNDDAVIRIGGDRVKQID